MPCQWVGKEARYAVFASHDVYRDDVTHAVTEVGNCLTCTKPREPRSAALLPLAAVAGATQANSPRNPARSAELEIVYAASLATATDLGVSTDQDGDLFLLARRAVSIDLVDLAGRTPPTAPAEVRVGEPMSPGFRTRRGSEGGSVLRPDRRIALARRLCLIDEANPTSRPPSWMRRGSAPHHDLDLRRSVPLGTSLHEGFMEIARVAPPRGRP